MSSLIDPNNPARWADGTPRSQNNGFTSGMTGEPIDWSGFTAALKRRDAQTKRIERARAAGDNTGTIASLSKRSDDYGAATAQYWRHPKRTAMVSIENREVGERSRDKRAALRKAAI
jgi:hypothetical protein